jgi:GMP synthase (glutamine-hydrolysing)
MKPVLIIRTGRAPDAIRARHGDFPHWFRLGAGVHQERVQLVDVAAGEALPATQDVAGAIITGSAAMVTEKLPWSEQTAGWIRDAMDDALPLFGVCYGHQLMAHALGGRVGYLPGGREIGTQLIDLAPGHEGDSLTGVLRGSFRAHTTHEQSVLEAPSGATILARSARDPHQLLRYSPNAISTQFHPEFNADVMRAYIRRKRVDLRREDADPEQIFKDVGATPVARRLLRQFARLHGWHAKPA